MNYNEKIDLFRYIGETLYDLYRRKQISLFPEYDTQFIKHDVDIYESIKETFLTPYQINETENVDDKLYNRNEELQVVLAAIKNAIVSYDRAKKSDMEKITQETTFSVARALEGSKNE